MDYTYALMDLTVYGRQETWEDSPPRLATTVAGRQLRDPDQRTPHRPVVATRSWTL
jgi:hypothetical protein